VFEDSGPSQLECSAKGCRAPAVYQILWNNPSLHTPEYRKTWLACDEHLEWLSGFLRARGFLRGTQRLPSAALAAEAAEAGREGDSDPA
jgi:hypothetical protein